MRVGYFRPAIAMIELIFAIVIMGIVLMSAPMLISTAMNSTSVALQQEGIHEALSRVNMIMTYPWDENDVNDVNRSYTPLILHVSNGDSDLNITANGRRIGVPENADRLFRSDSKEFNASSIGSDSGETNALAVVISKNDMDDFTNTSSLIDRGGTGGEDYIEQGTINIATSINYINDTANYGASTFSYKPSAGTATTNIKGITVTLTSSSSADELAKKIILKSFLCNIGGRAFKGKMIP